MLSSIAGHAVTSGTCVAFADDQPKSLHSRVLVILLAVVYAATQSREDLVMLRWAHATTKASN